MFSAPAGITSQLFPFVPVAQDDGEWGPAGVPSHRLSSVKAGPALQGGLLPLAGCG